MTKLLQSILASGEGSRTEFKSRLPAREVLGRVLCSFANSGGGTLVIGVGDKGQLLGVPDAASVAEGLARDAATILSPPISVSVNVVNAQGTDVVLVDVPEGADKPYTFSRKIFVRRGEVSAPVEVEELRKLITSGPRFEVRWERRMAAGVQPSDLDKDELDRLVTSARDLFGYSFPTGAAAVENLESLSLASNGQLQNGAVVLLAREPQRRFPQTRVRAVAFADEEETRMLDNKVLEGQAFKLSQDALQFIQSRIPVAATIPGGGLARRDEAAIPMVAIREALLNSVQHRDYEAYDGSIIIKVYPTRVAIWNPGELPQGMTLGELTRGHYSRPRNPDIAHAFFLRGFVERLGSGTTRILAAMRAAGLPDAEWETVSGGLQITLRRTAGGTELNDRQRAVLRHLAEGNAMTLGEYAKRFAVGVSDRQARGDLGDLVKKGLLVRRGSARSTRYERTGRKP